MRYVVVLCVILSMLSGKVFAGEGSLFVFLPTQVRATALQEKLSDQCRQLDITVFGRSRDFRKQIKLSKPDAILSLGPVVQTQSDYTPLLLGKQSDQKTEPYFFVSIDAPIDIKNVGSKRLGVVDWLGRKGMDQYIADAFGFDIRLKRVVKQEDLLPLLTFGFAEAIFVSKRTHDKLKETSNLNLVVVNTEVVVQLPVVAVKKTTDAQGLTACFSQLDTETNQLLGVEKWSDS